MLCIISAIPIITSIKLKWNNIPFSALTVNQPLSGFKSKNKTQGDLIAEVKIMVPKQLEEEEKKLFEKLNKVSKFNPRNT